MPAETDRFPVVTIALRIEVSQETLAAFADLVGLLRGMPAPPPDPVIPIPSARDHASATMRGRSDRGAPAATQTPPARKAPPPREKGGGNGRRGSWRTEERKTALRALWPTTTPVGEIFDRLSAMDGPPIPSRKYLGVFAAGGMKLKRPSSMMPLGFKLAASRISPGDASGDGKSDRRDVPHAIEKPPEVDAVSSAPILGGSVGGESSPRRPSQYEPPAAAPTPRPAARPPTPTIAKMARTPLVRTPADRQQITDFCRGRGWTVDTFDIDAINKRLGGLGHPGFDLIEPAPRRVGHAA